MPLSLVAVAVTTTTVLAISQSFPTAHSFQQPLTVSSPLSLSLSRPRNSRRSLLLFSTLRESLVEKDDDDDEEEYNNNDTDNDSNKFTYASSSEPFMSELETAEAANALLSSSSSSSLGRIELETEVSTSFMQYALSIIMGRALPDARDGLKPVHRRILYGMYALGLSYHQPHRKCARIVGEVLGKFHPHGDMAVYDALVRMAQTFSSGTPLVDGHGNFGSVDADPAAAMRYTECRLSVVAQEAVLDELQYDTVDFLPNFDGNEQEPTVLPAKLPLLLLNGCSGIAVGMATNVPPHNLIELMGACQALAISRKEGEVTVSDQRLLQLVPGPDFPTGSTIVGTSGAKQLYLTGNGGIVMRAHTQMERIPVGGGGGASSKRKSGKQKMTRAAIVVTALPYQVNKAFLLEKIASLVNDKKIDGIADLRDESDRDGIRVVIELKRDAVAAVVLNNLYKKTPLQTTFSGNFLALMGSGTAPQRFTLRGALDCFLDFRFETIRRKTAFQLRKVESRAHIVEGLLAALSCVDEVIDMIREASDQNAARNALMDENNKALGLSREQADAVLKLQLGQLTRLNKDKLEDEKSTLEASRKELMKLMTEDEAVLDVIHHECEHLKTKFGVDRKTLIEVEEGGEISEMDLIRNSRSVIVVTRGGYIKRMPLKTFERQRRGTRGKKGTSDQSEDNEVAHCFTCNDHDTILMVTRRGVAFGLRAFQVPTGGRTAKGTPIPAVLPVTSEDTVTTFLPVSTFSNDEYIVLATEHGWVKRTPLKAFENLTNRGLTIATLDDGDSLNWCRKCSDNDDILIGTSKGKAIRFEAEKLRPTGRTSRGVRALNLLNGDTVADMNVVKGDATDDEHEKATEYVLAVTSHGYGKRVPTSEFRAQRRGGQGVIAIKFKKNMEDDDDVSCLRVVQEDDEILLITSKGIMVRQKVSDIPSQGRAATGVLVQKVDVENGDNISSISIVPKYEERDE